MQDYCMENKYKSITIVAEHEILSVQKDGVDVDNFRSIFGCFRLGRCDNIF